jgi:hypothetical protein
MRPIAGPPRLFPGGEEACAMPFTPGHALLIGVGTYDDDRYSAPITLQDARDLADVLQDPAAAGYPPAQVRLLTARDAARAGVLQALSDLRAATDAESTVLLFLCGHGKADGADYFFLTSDAQQGADGRFRPDTVISAAELVTAVAAIPARKMLVLFNTCFAGVVAGSLDVADAAPAIGVTPPDQVVNAVLGAGEGRVVITACRRDQKSNYAGGAPNTLFTAALLAALRGAPGLGSRRGFIGAFELYDYVYESVRAGIARLAPDRRQDPVITIHEAVGPFPVALYHGGAGAASLAPGDDLRAQPQTTGPAVQVVPAAQAGRDFNQITGGGVNYGAISGPANLGSGTQVTTRDVQAGGGVALGSTLTAGGDLVMGNQERGDSISVGNISGSSGVAIGRGARATVTHNAGGDADALARAFASIYATIEARQPLPSDGGDKDDILGAVQKTQNEVAKGEQASPARVEQLLKQVATMAPDIAQVIAATLASPIAGIATAVRLVAEKARAGAGPASTAGG